MILKHYFSGPLQVNCYLAYDEATKKGFVVDPGGINSSLTKDAKELGIEIEYIILTHGHGDHIGGVEALQNDFPKAKLAAGKKEAVFLKNPMLNMSRETCGKAISLIPDVFVEEGDVLKVGPMEISFIETPGHTPGGICIFTEGQLFSGDTLFAQSIGRTDFSGGSFDDLMHSIKNKLFLLPDDTKVWPGHMGPTQIGFEKEHNPFV